MICKGCGQNSFHIKVFFDKNGKKTEVCNNCARLGSGPKIDGILTRNSFRIRRQQEKYAPDFVQPHVYDRHRRKLVFNKEFAKLYPDKVGDYFSEKELIKEGLPRLAQASAKLKRDKALIKQRQRDMVQYSGSDKTAFKKIIKSQAYARTAKP